MVSEAVSEGSRAWRDRGSPLPRHAPLIGDLVLRARRRFSALILVSAGCRATPALGLELPSNARQPLLPGHLTWTRRIRHVRAAVTAAAHRAVARAAVIGLGLRHAVGACGASVKSLHACMASALEPPARLSPIGASLAPRTRTRKRQVPRVCEASWQWAFRPADVAEAKRGKPHARRRAALHSLVRALRALPWRASSREPRSPAPPRKDSACQFRIADWTAGINLVRSTMDLHVPFAAADRHGFTHPWPSALAGTAATPDAADFPGSKACLWPTGSRQTQGPLQASPR